MAKFLGLFLTLFTLSSSFATLQNKVILVTGGSKGIGAEIVKHALKENAYVIYTFNGTSPTSEQANNKRLLALKADFSDKKAADKVWQQAVAWKGRIDTVINNAGVLEFVNPSEETEHWHHIWDHTLQVNLMTSADFCRLAINHFKAKNSKGVIINVSSRAAFRGYGPDGMAYAASKAGLVALTRSIARAYAKDKILAYTVAPGITETDMVTTFRNKYGEAVLEKIREENPMGEFASPTEVAKVILFLADGTLVHSSGMTFDINGATDFH